MADKNYGNNSQLAELVKYISDEMKFPIMGAGGGYAPIGTVNFFDATTAPLGWLACDGSIHNISDYPDLATFYASVHGASNFYGGNGTTTFAVPDLRGEFLRGSGTNSHENQGSGANVGVHQDATEHKNMLVGRDSGKLFVSKSSVNEGVPNIDSEFDKDKITDISLGSSPQNVGLKTFYTSRPTNTSFLICVKATLSDTELNNMHVYSPNEHQVGWWQEEVDGVLKQKPVYEKVVQNTPTLNGVTLIENVDELVCTPIIKRKYSSSDVNIVIMGDGVADTNYIGFTLSDNILKMVSTTSKYSGGIATVIVQFTKTTDQWQTV